MDLDPAWTAIEQVKLSVDDYLKLDGSDSFGGRYSELLDGTIYFRPHRLAREARIAGELLFALMDLVKASNGGFEVGMLGSIAMPPHDAPAPDITVFRKGDDGLLIPGSSVVLIIEVADHTLERDLGMKAAIYARHYVPEYWVVDVRGNVVHQTWAPGAEGYGERREVAFGERIEAVTMAGLAVETSGLA